MSTDGAAHADNGIESSRATDVVSEGGGKSSASDSTATDHVASLSTLSCCCRNVTMSDGLTLEDRFNKSLEINLKLADELATTRQQMQLLTTKLREFEVIFCFGILRSSATYLRCEITCIFNLKPEKHADE